MQWRKTKEDILSPNSGTLPHIVDIHTHLQWQLHIHAHRERQIERQTWERGVGKILKLEKGSLWKFNVQEMGVSKISETYVLIRVYGNHGWVSVRLHRTTWSLSTCEQEWRGNELDPHMSLSVQEKEPVWSQSFGGTYPQWIRCGNKSHVNDY